MGKINVTPLIDVVMCLIVFYLIVAKLASDRQAEVVLPSSRVGEEVIEAATLVVNVAQAADGTGAARIIAEGRELSSEELVVLLQSRREAGRLSGVQLRADRALPFASVQPVLRAAREAGLGSVTLVTSRQDGSDAGGAP